MLQLRSLAAAIAVLERDVAEARQLRQEEEGLLASTVDAMRRVWAQLVQVGGVGGAETRHNPALAACSMLANCARRCANRGCKQRMHPSAAASNLCETI